MNKTISTLPMRQPQTGFSLVEIMVGMVIAMLGILVMMQVFTISEGQKRTTTGGNDALNAGAIALFAVQRDIRQSGWGISNGRLIGCNLLLTNAVEISGLAPVTINHAYINAMKDANTDTLLIVNASTEGSTEGDGITSQPPSNNYAVQTPTSFNVNDRVIALPQTRPANCNTTAGRREVELVTGVVGPTVSVAAGKAGMSNGTLYNLGQTLTVRAYAIRNGDLSVCDIVANADCNTNAAKWVPIASSMVSLRAEYGKDTTAPFNGQVDAWNQTLPTTACEWMNTAAIRLVLVARSGQFEKAPVTTNAPAWQGATAIDLTATDDNFPSGTWQNYRYKVFENAVPIRNVSWVGGVC